MRFDKIISLFTETETNVSGQVKFSAPVYKTVFAELKSVNRLEFYQSAQAGFNPVLIFVIRLLNYNDEKKLKYKTKNYRIIRTYSTDNINLELVCEEWV